MSQVAQRNPSHEPAISIDGEHDSVVKDKPAAIIYGHTVLSASMTFIRSHGEALTSFVPIYAGAHRASNGLVLAEDRVVVVNDSSFLGKAKEYAFRTRGYAPGFVKALRARRPSIVTCTPKS